MLDMTRQSFFAFHPLVSAVAAVFILPSCDGSSSGDALAGLGDEFDIAALSEPVLRLCAEAECGDYSQSECEFYVRYDSLSGARFSEDAEACFDALVVHFDCLADAGSCNEESCDPPEEACVLRAQVSSIRVPEALEPTREACEFLADCAIAEGSTDRPLALAECQADLVSRAEIFLEDRGNSCAQSFIDFIACIGRADLSCDAGAEDEDEACPQESAAFTAHCFP